MIADTPLRYTKSPSLRFGLEASISITFIARLEATEMSCWGRALRGLARRWGNTDTFDVPDGLPLAELDLWLRGLSSVYQDLVEPASSFFRDIVVPAFAIECPLVLAVEPRSAGRSVIEVWGADHVAYSAEAHRIDLVREPARDWREFKFRDSLALFASGHVGYTLALLPTRENDVDEYDLIELQKIAYATESSDELRNIMRWRHKGTNDQGVPLLEFIRRRLDALRGTDGGHNAIRDVMTPLGRSLQFNWQDVRHTAVIIADPHLYRKVCGWLAEPGTSSSLVGGRAAEGAHMPEGLGLSLEERERRAFAGVVQGLLDFPYQDGAEITDSLIPFNRGPGFLMFAGSQSFLELCDESRPFREMIDFLGCCPYLFLTHLVLAYNSALVSEAEERLARRMYAPGKGSKWVRPLAEVRDVLESIDAVAVKRDDVVQELTTRVQVFSLVSFAYLPNIFRYTSERKTYDDLSTLWRLAFRRETLMARLDRYWELVRDVHDARREILTFRTERILIALTVITIVSVTADYHGLWRGSSEQGHFFQLWSGSWAGYFDEVATIAIVVAIYLIVKRVWSIGRGFVGRKLRRASARSQRRGFGR